MLIDCDTCTVRGNGCADCVVTVLLGGPPGWRGTPPTVIPIRPRGRTDLDTLHTLNDSSESSVGNCDVPHIDSQSPDPWSVVDLDEVERRAVGALAEFGLVPPLRHQDASSPDRPIRPIRNRHVS